MQKIISLLAMGGLLSILLLPNLSLAYTSKNVEFEPQDPGVDSGTGKVTTNAVSQYSGLGTQDPVDTAVLVINWALGLLGLIFLVLIIYAGFLWMLSAGKEDQIEKAQGIMKAAVIGLVVVLISYGVTALVFNVLINVTET